MGMRNHSCRENGHGKQFKPGAMQGVTKDEIVSALGMSPQEAEQALATLCSQSVLTVGYNKDGNTVYAFPEGAIIRLDAHTNAVNRSYVAGIANNQDVLIDLRIHSLFTAIQPNPGEDNADNWGLTQSEIAKALRVSRSKVRRTLPLYCDKGLIIKRYDAIKGDYIYRLNVKGGIDSATTGTCMN